MLCHDWSFFNWFYQLFMWYRILSLGRKGSIILWKCFNLLSPIYRESNVFRVKRNIFLSNVEKISLVILVVFSKIFACDRVSITYLFTQNSKLYLFILYACVYTLGILTEYLVFFIFLCSFERVTTVSNWITAYSFFVSHLICNCDFNMWNIYQSYIRNIF